MEAHDSNVGSGEAESSMIGSMMVAAEYQTPIYIKQKNDTSIISDPNGELTSLIVVFTRTYDRHAVIANIKVNTTC